MESWAAHGVFAFHGVHEGASTTLADPLTLSAVMPRHQIRATVSYIRSLWVRSLVSFSRGFGRSRVSFLRWPFADRLERSAGGSRTGLFSAFLAKSALGQSGPRARRPELMTWREQPLWRRGKRFDDSLARCNEPPSPPSKERGLVTSRTSWRSG